MTRRAALVGTLVPAALLLGLFRLRSEQLVPDTVVVPLVLLGVVGLTGISLARRPTGHDPVDRG